MKPGRRLRSLMGTPPLSYVPMLPVALLVTLIAIVVNLCDSRPARHAVPAGTKHTGVVVKVRATDRGQRCTVTLDSVCAELFVASHEPGLRGGDTIRFNARLEPMTPPTEPYVFDYAAHLRRQGVELSGYVPSEKFTLVRSQERTFIGQVRDIAAHSADLLDGSGLSDGTIVFLKAALLGDASEARDMIGDRFSAAGLAHVLALSGTHVATMYVVFTVLLFPLYLLRRRRLLVVCVVLLLWLYAVMTGMAPSVVRAVVMATCLALGFVTQRSSVPLNSWLLAWTLLLVADAGNLTDVGFQMSFAATGAILLLMPSVRDYARSRGRAAGWLIAAVGVSVAAMAGSGAIAAWHFHTFPLMFVLANLPVALLLPWLLGGGVLLCLLLWSGADAQWLCWILNRLYDAVAWIADVASSVRGAQLRGLWFSAWCLLPYFAALLAVVFALWRRNAKAWGVAAVLIAVTAVAFYVGSEENAAEEWFVTTAGGNTAVVHSRGTEVRYLSPLSGQLLENARADAGRTLANYLSHRGSDSLVAAGSWTGNTFDAVRVVYLSHDSVVDHFSGQKADYLIVGGQYRGPVGKAIDRVRPDTVLLAREMHWRRRRHWTDSLHQAGVPCVWLHNHRFGLREIAAKVQR